MDSSMINVALPSIMRSFSTTLARAEWVVLIYLLTITVSLLIWGYLADSFGQGKIYLHGMLIFTLGSAVCYLATSLSLLIFFRFIQAIGAAMMMSSGSAIIKNIFPREQLGRSLGLLGVATSIGLMSGPVMSGFLLRYYSWRAIFLVTVPISLGAFLMGRVFLMQFLSEKITLKKIGFDWYGSLLWILLVTLAVLFTSHANEVGVVQKIIGAIIFIIAGKLFWVIEKRHAIPLVPFFLLRRKEYGIAILVASLSFVVLFIVLILMPFYMDFVLRIQVDTIGYVMMAVPVTLFVVSPVSGWLYDFIGAAFLTTTGLSICCFSVILLIFLSPESTPFDIAWRLALLGCGQSIFLSPNTASVLSGIEKEYTGITSGLLATSRNIGMLSGVAIAGMIFTAFFSFFSGGLDLKEYSSLHVNAFMYSFQSTLAIAAVLALAGGILSVLRK